MQRIRVGSMMELSPARACRSVRCCVSQGELDGGQLGSSGLQIGDGRLLQAAFFYVEAGCIVPGRLRKPAKQRTSAGQRAEPKKIPAAHLPCGI
jgi:hypothetical protein